MNKKEILNKGFKIFLFMSFLIIYKKFKVILFYLSNISAYI